MRFFSRNRLVAGALALVVAVGAGAEPGLAGSKWKGKQADKVGSIDPTNVPVLESDEAIGCAPTSDPSYMGDASMLYAYNADVLDVIGAKSVHESVTGRGVLVAVLDGGFDLQHPAIARRAFAGRDCIDGDWDPESLGNGFDDDGDGIVDGGLQHGTFAAAMVLLVAPEATVLAIRVRDDEGFGTDEELANGIREAAKAGAHVISMSVEGAVKESNALNRAVDQARRRGVILITSAGNHGEDELAYDSLAHLCTLSVGATDNEGNVAPFSNYEDLEDSNFVLAPGVDLFGPIGNSWGRWSGTSFATPLVAGAAALLVERCPGISPDDACAIMRHSASAVTGRDGEQSAFTGMMDVTRVVNQ